MSQVPNLESNTLVVFVSYSRANEDFVAQLIADLADRGINCWFDRTHIRPGDPDWDEAIRAAIRASHGVVLVATPESRQSRHVKGEIDLAQRYERAVYPIWAQGDAWIDSVALGLSTTQYIDARGSHYAEALERLVGILTTTSGEPSPVMLLPEPDFEPRNPYKGLRAFSEQDASDFYGRQRLVADLIAQVGAAADHASEGKRSGTARLLAVVGPSGSGKSSVVHAGVLPKLRAGALARSDAWIYLRPLKPGAQPEEALAGCLSAALQHSVIDIAKDLRDDSTRGLHLLARVLAAREEQRVLLIVDQFEELFTQTDPAARRHFIDLLVTAATEPRGPLVVLLVLRSDYYHQLMLYPDLWPIVHARTVFVTPMSVEDLRAAIVEPARQQDTKLAFEKDLVGDLLFEIRGQEGALPLLQFTLDKLFEHREGHRLTQAAYQAIGRVHGALAQHADNVYERVLSQEQREVAQSLFLRLVDPDAGSPQISRRRMPYGELVQADPRRSELLHETADAFVQGRLLVVDAVQGERTLEVAHEALIGAWPRLQRWIQDNRANLLQHRQITDDAARWVRSGSDESLLYRGSRLAAALGWRDDKDHASSLSQFEASFLAAGADLRDRELYKERERARREVAAAQALARSERRRGRLARAFSAVLAVALVAMAVVAVIALEQRDLANRESQAARSRALAASAVAQLQTDPELSLLLAAAATRTDDTAEAINALRQSLVASHVRMVDRSHAGGVTSADFAPDGRFVITGDVAGLVRIWETATGATLLQTNDPPHLPVLCVAISPNGSLAAWGGSDDRAHVLDLRTRAEIGSLANGDVVTDVAFSPNGQLLATSDIGGVVTVWDAAARRRLAVLRGGIVGPVKASFSPRGDTLLTVGPDERAHLWRWASATMLAAFGAAGTRVDVAAFVANGTRIVTGHSDGTTRIWNAETGQLIAVFSGHAGEVTDISAFPTGNMFVSTGADGTARVWDAARGRLIHVLSGHSGKVLRAAVSGDSRLVATVGTDNTVRLWDAGTGLLLATLAGHTRTITTVAFDPRMPDQAVLTASMDGTARLWDISTFPRLNPQLWHIARLSAETWSADGSLVAVAVPGTMVQIRSAASGAVVQALAMPAPVTALAFSPDGKLLASVVGGSAEIWSVAGGQLQAAVPVGAGAAMSVAFSPDNKSLAVVFSNGTGGLWSTQGAAEQTLRDSQELIGSLGAFSPDGSTLATIGVAGRLDVWDTRTGALLFSPPGIVSGVWFSPDGRWLLRVTRDLAGGLWYARLCDARTGTEGRTIDEDTGPSGGDDVTTALFTHNGSTIITARSSGLLCHSRGPQWPMATCDLSDHAGAVLDLALNPAGTFLATAGSDGSVRVWGADTGQMLAQQSDIAGSPTAVVLGADDLLQVVHVHGASQTLAVYRCRVCGPAQELLSLAQARVTRQLTAAERAQYVQAS